LVIGYEFDLKRNEVAAKTIPNPSAGREHRLRNVELEEKFLAEIEQDIDSYVSQVMQAKGEVLYEEPEPKQLMLFEEMGEYLANRRLQRTANHRR